METVGPHRPQAAPDPSKCFLLPSLTHRLDPALSQAPLGLPRILLSPTPLPLPLLCGAPSHSVVLGVRTGGRKQRFPGGSNGSLPWEGLGSLEGETGVGGFQGLSALDAVALARAAACALRVLKQQARADGERRGRNRAPECLAGKPLRSLCPRRRRRRRIPKEKLPPSFLLKPSPVRDTPASQVTKLLFS